MKDFLSWCTTTCFTSCSMWQQLEAAGAPALSWRQLLSLLMQEELAERRRCEKMQRQRLKQKLKGKDQGAVPGTVDASEEPSDEEPCGEERVVLSIPSLPDQDGPTSSGRWALIRCQALLYQEAAAGQGP